MDAAVDVADAVVVVEVVIVEVAVKAAVEVAKSSLHCASKFFTLHSSLFI